MWITHWLMHLFRIMIRILYSVGMAEYNFNSKMWIISFGFMNRRLLLVTVRSTNIWLREKKFGSSICLLYQMFFFQVQIINKVSMVCIGFVSGIIPPVILYIREDTVAFPQCIASNKILYRLSHGLLVMKDTLAIKSHPNFNRFCHLRPTWPPVQNIPLEWKQCIVGRPKYLLIPNMKELILLIIWAFSTLVALVLCVIPNTFSSSQTVSQHDDLSWIFMIL